MAEIARLPTPVTSNWDWQIDAACRGLNPSTFFHPENERGRSKRQRDARAKAVCARCRVRQTCLDWAMSVREPYGVWGGLSSDERADLLEAVNPSVAT